MKYGVVIIFNIVFLKQLLTFSSSGNTIITELKPNEIDKYIINTAAQVYQFYSVLDTYMYREENTITVHFSKEIKQNKLLKAAYANIVNLHGIPDKSLFPIKKEDSIFPFKLWNTSETLYHLYFNKHIPQEKSMHTYLLFFIEIDNPDGLRLDASFVLSNQIIESKFSSFKKEIIKIEKDIPIYIKYYLPYNNHDSAIIYFSSPATVFYGNLLYESLSSIAFNDNYKTKQLIAFDSEELQEIDIITMKFCCEEQVITIIREMTGSSLRYIDDPLSNGLINYEDIQCTIPYYLVFNFEKPYNFNIYSDRLFGLFQIYHDTNYEKEVIEFRQTLLPNKLNYLEDIYSMKYTMEIIGIQCISPGSINLHIFDTMNTVVLQPNKKTFLLVKGTIKITLAPYDQSTYLELSTPYEKEVLIDNTIKLTKANPYNESLQPQSARSFILSSNTATYAIVNYIKPNIFQIKESKGLFFTTNQYIVFKMPKPTQMEYNQLDISFEFGYEDFSYTYGYGNLSNIAINDDTKLSFIKGEMYGNYYFRLITQPYNKYNSKDIDGHYYYLAINFKEESGFKIKIQVNYANYSTYKSLIEINTLSELSMENNVVGLKRQKISDEKAKLFVFISLCTPAKYHLKHSYSGIIISEYEVIKQNTFLLLNNNLINSDLRFTKNDASSNSTTNIDNLFMSYDYSSILSYDFYVELNDLNYELSFDGKTLSWINPGQNRYFNGYRLYQFLDENNTSKEHLMGNLCYLQTMKYKMVNHISIDILNSGVYWVNVVGIVKGSLEAYIPFKPKKITVHKNNIYWLWIILGIFAVLSIGNIIYFKIRNKNNEILVPDDHQSINVDEDMIASNISQ